MYRVNRVSPRLKLTVPTKRQVIYFTVCQPWNVSRKISDIQMTLQSPEVRGSSQRRSLSYHPDICL